MTEVMEQVRMQIADSIRLNGGVDEMQNQSKLSFNTPKVKVKVERKLSDYQKRYGISDRDMTYILMQELFHYYIGSLISK